MVVGSHLFVLGKRLVVMGLNRFSSVSTNNIKAWDRQLKRLQIDATATAGLVFFGSIQFGFGLFFGPMD